MDRVKIARNLRVGFVCEGRVEDSSARGRRHRIAIVRERGTEALRSTVALQICDYRITTAIIALKVDGANFDKLLQLVTDENGARHNDRTVVVLVLVRDLGLQSEDETSTCLEWFGFIVPFKPLLRLQDTNASISLQIDEIIRLVNDLEGVLIIDETAAIQERGRHFNDGTAVTNNITLDLNGLAGVTIDDRSNLRFSVTHVSRLKSLRTGDDL